MAPKWHKMAQDGPKMEDDNKMNARCLKILNHIPFLQHLPCNFITFITQDAIRAEPAGNGTESEGLSFRWLSTGCDMEVPSFRALQRCYDMLGVEGTLR